MRYAAGVGITYRREIDGLRAIAVLSVVLYHAGIPPAAGYVGVDIFFVISGYLITALLLREHASTGSIDLLAFYARRVRRIFPAAIVLVLATLGLCALVLPPADLSRAANSAGAAALFGANLFFQFTTGGYFDASAEQMPLLHLWSLSVEEQFYFLWPAILIVLLRWRRQWLVPAIIGLGLASFACAEILLATNPQAAFYQMPARFWELAIGGLVAAMPANGGNRAAVAGCAVLAILTACAVPLAHFPGIGALPAVLGAAVLLWAVHQGEALGPAGAFLRSPPMVGVGLVSYSFYLWHWPLLALYRATTIGEGQAAVRLALCALALVIAAASYRYIEQPFRRLRTGSGRLVLAGSAVSLSVALGACAVGYRVQQEQAARPVDNPLALKAERDMPKAWRRCHYSVGDTIFPKPNCETIPGKPVTVAMWGDSMAMSWKPFAAALASPNAAIDYSRDACQPLLGYLAPEAMPGDVKCRDFNAKAAEAVKGVDTLVLAGRWAVAFRPDRGDSAAAGLRRTLEAVAPTVRRVLILGPTPELRDSAPKCIRAGRVSACDISRADFNRTSAAARAYLEHAAKGFDNVEIVEPADMLCSASTCPAVLAGVPLYWDSHHATASAAAGYAQHLVAR